MARRLGTPRLGRHYHGGQPSSSLPPAATDDATLAIDAHPRPVNNETPLASTKRDPNSRSDFPVKLLSVDEVPRLQGLPRKETRRPHSLPSSIPSSQHGDEEAVGAVTRRGEEERRVAAVGRRRAGRRRRPRPMPRARASIAKLRVMLQKPGDLVAVLLRQHRAGGVDEAAAGLRQRAPPHRAWRAARSWRWARLAGLSRHLASGRRRQAPLPVQGASTNTRSNRGPSAVSAARVARGKAPGHCARRPASAARRWGAGEPHRRRRRRSGRCCA